MADKNLVKQIKQTYLAMIKNSPGTKLFNTAYVKNLQTGEIYDVFNDGELSCAFFVSGLLSMVGLLDRPHSTVKTLVALLSESKKWSEVPIDEPEAGDVIVWDVVTFDDGTTNEHVGFYLGEGEAVSTSYKEKQVVKHSADFEGQRKIAKLFRPKIK
jgi:hypothetical protein